MTVTVTAADPDGESATQSFQVTVPNRPPEAVGTIPGQALTEGGTESLVLTPYFNDLDGDALTYTAASANPAVALGTVSGSVLTIRATGTGFTVITITATDPGGLTATQIVTVVVTARNSAPQPQGSIPAQSVTAGRSATVNLTSYFTDPDGDALTYTASSANPSVATATAAGATLTITGQSPGSTTVTVTARDPGGLTATQSTSVSVGTAAMPDLLFSSVTPTAVTIAPGGSERLVFTIRNAGNGNSAPTSARAHQSQDARITTSDRVASNPIAVRGLAPNGTTSLELTIPIPADFQPGSFYVGMCVDPVTGESNTANNCSNAVRVTVAVGNQAPQPRGTIPAVSVTAGQMTTVDLSLHFTDPDGDLLSYTASSSNPAVATVALTGSTLTVRGVAQGSATITVVASDPGGLTAVQAVSVSVGAAGFPDLSFSNVTPTQLTITPGVPSDVRFTIRNAGTVNSAPTNAQARGSEDATITTSDGVLGNQVAVEALAPNAETTVTVPVEVPSGSNPGSFHVGMCVDPVAGETNTANNCSSAVKVTVAGGATRLTNHSADDSSPDWSPDGTKIAFTSDRDANREIYVMNVDGSSPMRLTNHSAPDSRPDWSPDGTKIAFTSARDANREIYVMNVNGTGVTNLTMSGLDDASPAWSPDGRRIAFTSNRGSYDIHVMSSDDGSGVRRVTNSSGTEHSPAWSPDGNRIAFHFDPGGGPSNTDIYVVNAADGSGLTRLTSHSASDRSAVWSPDGTRIAFTSGRDGNSEIYVMSANGSGVMNLTNHPSDDYFAAWSPDGAKIAFVSIRDGNWEIYVMPVPASAPPPQARLERPARQSQALRFTLPTPKPRRQ